MILDDFCIRNTSGNTVGWVFGLSMFSLKGDHIGWCEEGVFYDIENNILGFVPDAAGMPLATPGLAPEPPMPAFSKRPYVPGLHARSARPRGSCWSVHSLVEYFAPNRVPASTGMYRLPLRPGAHATGFRQR